MRCPRTNPRCYPYGQTKEWVLYTEVNTTDPISSFNLQKTPEMGWTYPQDDPKMLSNQALNDFTTRRIPGRP